MEFIKYIKILGCALFVVSCGSSPKKYELDGSDIPGYSKNEYYGFIEFSRPKGFTSYTINNIDLYYNVPGTYTTVGVKGLTSNLGVATLLPFLVRPTVQSHKQMDSLVQETGVREGANKQVISSQADSLIKISRIWADFFPANT
ncbi:hypothetical protein KKZ80_00005, partial [Enterobacter kobei]|uniref:hypothetical protein n=1 Tax=Enterobacter kobei TaxID=208224 RepID=UPI001BE08CF7